MYASVSLASFRSALANRLADPTLVHWTSDELTRYTGEALRTWNAYTQGYRSRGVFDLAAQTTFYDLGTQLQALRALTVTNWDLTLDLEYSLLEPPTPKAWTGSSQFTLADLTDALTRRRNQFLWETGSILTREVFPIASSPTGRTAIPDRVLRLRRAAWEDATGLVTPLRLDDEWAANNYRPGWPQTPQRTPLVCSVAATPPLQVQFIPPPLDTGQLDACYVAVGSTLTPTSAVILGVPDDWSWVVKFGALADLLSRDGLALDPVRSAYCEQRWQQGIQAAKAASVVLDGRLNDQPCGVGSISDADNYSPLWQTAYGIPRQLVTAGMNLVAAWPGPNSAATYSVSLDVVANIPVPLADADVLQINSETFDALLDYAQHLALLKEGAAQLMASKPLLDRFLRFCGVEVSTQQAQQPARAALLNQTSEDTQAIPAQVGA